LDFQTKWLQQPVDPLPPSSRALLLFIETTNNCISRMLAKHNIKMVGILQRKISSFLWSVKDDQLLKHQASVERFTRDKRNSIETRVKGTITIYGFTIQISWTWQKKTLT
jgi:hypothetical protein